MPMVVFLILGAALTQLALHSAAADPLDMALEIAATPGSLGVNPPLLPCPPEGAAASERRPSTPKPRLRILENPAIAVLFSSYLQNPGVFTGVDQKSEFTLPGWDLRFDLIMADLIDQMDELIKGDAKKWQAYQGLLDDTLHQKPLERFVVLISHLEAMGASPEHEKFLEKLNKTLLVQEYTLDGIALPNLIQVIQAQRGQKIDDNHLAQFFNARVGDYRATQVLEDVRRSGRISSRTGRPTIRTAHQLKDRDWRGFRVSDATRYQAALQASTRDGGISPHYEWKVTEDGLPPVLLKRKGKDDHWREGVVSYFNAIERLPYKKAFLDFVREEFAALSPPVSLPLGIEGLPPEFIEAHYEELKQLSREFTYFFLMGDKNDEAVQGLRKWIKENRGTIVAAQTAYNQAHPDATISVSFPGDKLPRRSEVIEQFEELSLLLPEAPWSESMNGVFVDAAGLPVAVDKKAFGRLMVKVKAVARDAVQPENLVSMGAATGITLLTGNALLGATSQVVLHHALDTLIHDKSVREGLEGLPEDLVGAVLFASPWSPGHGVKMIALGAMGGGLQSALTGQNVFTGAAVGAGSRLLGSFLPSELTSPTLNPGGVAVENLSRSYIWKQVALDVGMSSLRHGAQGAAVSALSGERLSDGFARGAAYGAVAEGAATYFIGMRVDPRKFVGNDAIEQALGEETQFQNQVADVGRGQYNITSRDLDDTGWRIFVPKQQAGINLGVAQIWNGPGASFTGPGFISLAPNHLNDSTIGHELSHAEQQEILGVANFYFRYIQAGKHGTTNGLQDGGSNPYEYYLYDSDPISGTPTTPGRDGSVIGSSSNQATKDERP